MKNNFHWDFLFLKQKIFSRLIFLFENRQCYQILTAFTSAKTVAIQEILYLIVVCICVYAWECVSDQFSTNGKKQGFNKKYFPHEIRRAIQNTNRAAGAPKSAFCSWLAYIMKRLLPFRCTGLKSCLSVVRLSWKVKSIAFTFALTCLTNALMESNTLFPFT